MKNTEHDSDCEIMQYEEGDMCWTKIKDGIWEGKKKTL